MVMMVIGIAVMIAFMLTTNGMFQLSVAQTTFNNARARNLAESVVALGVDSLQKAIIANNLGPLLASPSPETLTLLPPQVPAGCSATLTFDQNSAGHLPFSTCNLMSKTSLAGFAGTVPPGCAELIGIGQSGASVIRIRAVVCVPTYPFVVSSSSRFTGDGVTVARATGFPSGSPSGSPSIAPCQYAPGDVVSNCTGAPAVTLLHSKVTGNAEAVGSVYVDAGSTVQGAVEVGIPAVVLPSINPSTNPVAGYAGQQSFPPPPSGCKPLVLSGLIKGTPGPCATITVPGDLDLNGAVVYICGSLQVNGALQGTGALYTKGSLKVSGGASLTACDMVAVVAGGDVCFSAPCGSPANFVGFVYTAGNFNARNFHLFGNFVANDGGHGRGNVSMHNTTVVSVDSVSLGLALSGVSFGTGSTACGGYGSYCLNFNPTPNPCCHYYSVGHKVTVGPYCKCLKPCQGIHFGFQKQPNGCFGLNTCTTLSGKGCLHYFTCTQCTNALRKKLFCTVMCKLSKTSSGSSICLVKGSCGKWSSNPPTMIHCLCLAVNAAMCAALGGHSQQTTVGPLYRVPACLGCAPGTIYSFNFNQFIAPGEQTRVLLWEEF
jgi:hypothetical protein